MRLRPGDNWHPSVSDTARCWYCNRLDPSEADHWPMPKRLGGRFVVPACRPCHRTVTHTELSYQLESVFDSVAARKILGDDVIEHPWVAVILGTPAEKRAAVPSMILQWPEWPRPMRLSAASALEWTD